MAKYLVIVESPAKVKTIKKFLGSNYEVVASNGHVRDLPKSTMGIDMEMTTNQSTLQLGERETSWQNFVAMQKKQTKYIWQLTRTVREKQFHGTYQ